MKAKNQSPSKDEATPVKVKVTNKKGARRVIESDDEEEEENVALQGSADAETSDAKTPAKDKEKDDNKTNGTPVVHTYK